MFGLPLSRTSIRLREMSLPTTLLVSRQPLFQKMILTHFRLAIAISLVSIVTVRSAEPDRQPIVKPACLQVTSAQDSSWRISRVWLEEMSQPVRRQDLSLEPSASCAATSCHGGPRPGIAEPLAVRGAEYPLWLENDPHAQSWRTLCSPTSLAMLERLNIMQSGKLVNAIAFDNCLACHNSARGYEAASNLNHSELNHSELNHRVFNAEGVGCANCHGRSQNWRSDHYRLPRDNASNAAIGLAPNKDLFVRARVCAACHIGDSDRDVNHDIIAAGHPALHYEFTTFHNMLPKHWRESERSATPDFEAKLWLAGQVAALDASLALLESRAAKSLSVGTWPEFAASDCSSCHQNLRLGAKKYEADARGSANTFSTWNRFGVEQLLSQEFTQGNETPTTQKIALSLDHLSKLMSAGAIPEAAAVQVAAHNARRDLDAWLRHSASPEMLRFSASSLHRVAAIALADRDKLNSWEFTAQTYLAVIAARSSWMSSADTTALNDASQLRRALLFKPFTHSISLLDDPQREIQSTTANLLKSLQPTSNVQPPRDNTNSKSLRGEVEVLPPPALHSFPN